MPPPFMDYAECRAIISDKRQGAYKYRKNLDVSGHSLGELFCVANHLRAPRGHDARCLVCHRTSVWNFFSDMAEIQRFFQQFAAEPGVPAGRTTVLSPKLLPIIIRIGFYDSFTNSAKQSVNPLAVSYSLFLDKISFNSDSAFSLDKKPEQE